MPRIPGGFQAVVRGCDLTVKHARQHGLVRQPLLLERAVVLDATRRQRSDAVRGYALQAGWHGVSRVDVGRCSRHSCDVAVLFGQRTTLF